MDFCCDPRCFGKAESVYGASLWEPRSAIMGRDITLHAGDNLPAALIQTAWRWSRNSVELSFVSSANSESDADTIDLTDTDENHEI